MTDENKPLDLDQLFGEDKPVKVKLKGKEYELMSIQAVSPQQAVKLQKLQLRGNKLQSLQANPKEMSPKQAHELDNLLDEILKMLCPELPLSEMTSVQKMRTIVFYMEQTQGKKILEAALGDLIGATPSAS